MLAVNVVVTCSNRKTLAGAVALRDIPAAAIKDRARMWVERLESDGVRVPAHELYAGEHWSVVKSLHGIADQNGFDLHVWICSAGYGLVSWSSLLRSYAATFAGGHPDSVATVAAGRSGRTEREEWWAALADWSGPREGDPRSLAGLAARTPSTPLVVAVSPNYLRATASDLKDARSQMRPNTALIVMTSESGLVPELAEVSIFCSARLQNVVHGPRNSLTVRTLRLLLSRVREIGISEKKWGDYLTALSDRQPPLMKYDRAKLTDVELRRFVRQQLATDARASHTTLLRRLRDSGRACEQARFRNLYLKVRGGRTA